MKKLMAMLLVLFILFTSASGAFAAKSKDSASPTSEPIPEPTLSPDAAEKIQNYKKIIQNLCTNPNCSDIIYNRKKWEGCVFDGRTFRRAVSAG